MKLTLLLLFIIAFISVSPLQNIETLNMNQEKVKVTILGEVVEPKILELHPKSSIKDVLKFVEPTSEADIARLNLNERIKDDMVITLLPKKKDECISINYATSEELQTLSGVGPSTAQKIIEYREENGQFTLIEDILEIKGIGESKFKKIKDQVCL